METMQFHVPVRLNLNGEIREIESVREAAAFLQDWPASRRGPVFMCAQRGCQAAIGSTMRVNDARKAFESFARITGILATATQKSVALPGMPIMAPTATTVAH